MEDDRDPVEVVMRRGRGDGPLQRADLPGIRRGLLARDHAREEVVDEEELRGSEHQRRARDPDVHAVQVLQELVIGVVVEAPLHAAIAHDEHAAEDDGDRHDRQPEVPLAERLVHHLAEHFREPEVDGDEGAEQDGCGHRQVKVADHEVGIVQEDIGGDGAQVEAREAAQTEHEDDPDREEHRRREPDRAAPHRPEPVQKEDRGRDRDEHRERHEALREERAHADDEHVMAVDGHRQERDGGHREGRRLVPERGLAREEREDVRDDAPRGEDQDVDLRVPEDPEEVLIEDGVSSPLGHRRTGQEEVAAGDAVEEEEDHSGGQDRHEEGVQNRGHPDAPDRERHLEIAHSWCAEADDRRDVVDGPHDRARAREEDRHDPHRLPRPGLTDRGREGRIALPAAGRRAHRDEERADEDEPRRDHRPEREHVERGEGHVPRADHQRDAEVPERADEDRRDGEEDHDRPVHREERGIGLRRKNAPGLRVEELAQDRKRGAGLRDLPADHHGHDSAHHEEEEPIPEELLGDDLVVEREDVFLEEVRRVGMDVLLFVEIGSHVDAPFDRVILTHCTHSQPHICSLSAGSKRRTASPCDSFIQASKSAAGRTFRSPRIL